MRSILFIKWGTGIHSLVSVGEIVVRITSQHPGGKVCARFMSNPQRPPEKVHNGVRLILWVEIIYLYITLTGSG